MLAIVILTAFVVAIKMLNDPMAVLPEDCKDDPWYDEVG